uniref:Uncharacterized protein LOC104212176 n=1 Tax=Nicotiana sylvestris TaxID=4096 RepID=A0A1U7UUF8_NICSY|nr:PREDICTED: uncharacterized protein LOC104212176 [Nicotiana sylvestris]
MLNQSNEYPLEYSSEDRGNLEEMLDAPSQGISRITLTDDDKRRIYEPWKNVVIVKLFGKRMLYQYLRQKIQELWRPMEQIKLIDLGEDYFIIKFVKRENMDTALHQEFYDTKTVERIGNSIGRLLKIDVCTSTTIRGCYARLCVEIPLEHPVQPYIYIGTHKKSIHYEGEKLFCTICGRLGHISTLCSFAQKPSKLKHNPEALEHDINEDSKAGEWKVVNFNKNKRHHGKIVSSNKVLPKEQQEGPGISVNLFHASTGNEGRVAHAPSLQPNPATASPPKPPILLTRHSNSHESNLPTWDTTQQAQEQVVNQEVPHAPPSPPQAMQEQNLEEAKWRKRSRDPST